MTDFIKLRQKPYLFLLVIQKPTLLGEVNFTPAVVTGTHKS